MQLSKLTSNHQNRHRGKRRTIVIVAEGARDRNLNNITSNQVKDILVQRLNLDARATVLGHTQRGGAACVYDRWLSTMQGVKAIKLLLETKPTSPSQIVTVRQNTISQASLMEAVELSKVASNAVDNKDFDKVLSLRDAEFQDYHRVYETLTLPSPQNTFSPSTKRVCLPHLSFSFYPFW